MTRVFDDEGNVIPVTVVSAGPCVVVQRKTAETDGYEAIQLGYEEKKRNRVNQPMTGHFASLNVAPQKTVREFGLVGDEELNPGDTVTVEMFEEGQIVDVSGVSKGRGFTGVMKRYDFKGGPASHGSKVHRQPMSAGATDDQRVFKGQRMPGRMGGVKCTVKAQRVVKVDAERNVLLIRGAVPGPNGGLVTILSRA